MARDESKENINELKRQLKENRIGKLYLFTGPEQFLVRYYEKEMIKKILEEDTKTLNYSIYDGKVSFQTLLDAISVYPIFSQRRVVTIKESTLPKSASKDLDWGAFFTSLPDYICLIFIQEEVDKRISFYKQMKKHGLIVEFKHQDERALTKWVMKAFASYNKQIDERSAAYLVSLLDPDMTFMALEIEKIARFMGETTVVTRETIDCIAAKSVKSRIFDLTDTISQRQTHRALALLNDLIEQREPVPYIMAMVGRQMGILLKTKQMEEKRVSPAEMSRVLGVPSFIVGKIRKQASTFTLDMLKQYTRKCMEMDLASKTGQMEGRMALDLFLIEMGSR